MDVWAFGNLKIWPFGNLAIQKFGHSEIWLFGYLEIGHLETWKLGVLLPVSFFNRCASKPVAERITLGAGYREEGTPLETAIYSIVRVP